MGKQGKAPSWTIPEYTDPSYKTFGTSYGDTSYKDGKFSYNPSASNLSFQNDLEATRSALLKHMGGTDQATNDSLNQWQKTYFDEAQRLSQPQLEGSLFQRGLGGSSMYTGSLNDLITKNANQAILNKYQLQNQDFNQNQTAFGNVNTALNNQYGQGDKLLGLQADYANNQDSRNLDLYKTTLPYKATYNKGKQGQGWGKVAGTVIGGVGGAFMGMPLQGAQLGGAIGGGIDASQGYGSYGSEYIDPLMSAAGGFGGFGGGSSGMMSLNNLSMSNLPSNFKLTGSQGSNADLASKYGYL